MTFRSDAIRINVDLSDPIDSYYHMIQNRGDFLSGIEYSSFGNTLKNVCPTRTINYVRNNRILAGHVQNIQYITSFTI